MNILVSGANGFVGRALCDYLSGKGHNTYALVRKPIDDLNVKDQFIVQDFLQYDEWDKPFKGIDVVIHTAGLAHVKGRPDKDYFDINAEIPKRVALEAAKAGVKRFVFLSSIHVHASSSSDEILTPLSPFNPTTAYGKSKLQAEEALRDIEKKTGLEVVIIRPPLVYGPGAKGNVELLIKAIQKSIPFPFRGANNRRSMVYIENLVDAITLSATHPDAKGHTFFVSDDQPLSIQDLIQGLSKGLGKSPLLFYMPEFAMRFPLKVIGKEDVLDKIIGSLQLDISDIKDTLGWKPVVSPQEGLMKTSSLIYPKQKKSHFVARLLLLALLGLSPLQANDIRPPFVAGQFYPDKKQDLQTQIDDLLGNIQLQSKPTGKIYGFVVPHAGYKYSGKTAAYAYKILETVPVDTVILIGPYHKARFDGVSIWDKGKWETPLGSTSINQGLAEEIKQHSQSFQYDKSLHLTEHSLEVELPFIQIVAPHAKIVPILISDPAYSLSLAKAIYESIKDQNVIVLASSDLSHYYTDEQARQIDTQTIDLIHKGNPDEFRKGYDAKKAELCGGAAVLTLLELSKLWRSTKIDILHSANSGDTTKNKENVVGYVSAVVHANDSITPENQKRLLKLARTTLTAYLNGRQEPKPCSGSKQLSEIKAVFVTLRDKGGKLRGCIGQLKAKEPLYKAVQHMVISAATKDNRFPPIQADELKNINIEISILSELKTVPSINDIMMGVNGVIVSKENQSGVFLPEVADSFESKEMFLSELCSQKAKLPKDCWEDPAVKIQTFTTQNFKEKLN